MKKITPLLAMAVLILTGPTACAADSRQEEINKKNVIEFYDKAINQKDFEAASKYLGPKYIQHNPMAADGPEGLKSFLEFARTNLPDYHTEFKRVFADGDYVIVHALAKRNAQDRGSAVIDIFRLENGKVVEHWDVVQPIPEKANNSNGMF
ncbi:MAG: ester cyclase [Gammaproteobacteria bacterium]